LAYSFIAHSIPQEAGGASFGNRFLLSSNPKVGKERPRRARINVIHSTSGSRLLHRVNHLHPMNAAEPLVSMTTPNEPPTVMAGSSTVHSPYDTELQAAM
jgi:hypothetical protein